MSKSKRPGEERAAASRRAALTALEVPGAGQGSGGGGAGAPPRGLSADERFALDHYAADHDYKRTWKASLRDDWMRAMSDYARSYPEGASVLQRLRTASYFGSRGLDTYRAGKVPAIFDGRLKDYLDAPSVLRWERVYSFIIPGTTRTLWQAWSVVDGAAPTSRPAGASFVTFPDELTVRRAIQAARAGRVPVGLQRLEEAHARAPSLARPMTLERIEAMARQAGFLASRVLGGVVVSVRETEPLAFVTRIPGSETGIRVQVSASLHPDVRNAVAQAFSRRPDEPWREVSISLGAPSPPQPHAPRPRVCAYCGEPILGEDDVFVVGPDPEAPGHSIEVHEDCHAADLGLSPEDA